MNLTITDKVLTMVPFTEEWEDFKTFLLKEKELSDISYAKVMKDQCTLEDIVRMTDISNTDLNKALALMDTRENEISQYFGFKL